MGGALCVGQPVDCAKRPGANDLSHALGLWPTGSSLRPPRPGRSGNHNHRSTSGQFDNPARVVAFNTAERWAEDVSDEIAREITSRGGVAGDELSASLAEFVEQHLG